MNTSSRQSSVKVDKLISVFPEISATVRPST